MTTLIEVKNVQKIYTIGNQEIKALSGVSMQVDEGEFVALMGPSGSGKSTLMNLLGCLDKPTFGDYMLDGISVMDAGDKQLAAIRNKKIGFVFQSFNLLARTTAINNVEVPMIYAGIPAKERKSRAAEMLNSVGLGERKLNKPNELSGGQQQRVSIARALVNNPVIVLADEPTGALDSKTSIEIMGIFQKLNDQGKTIILVTHEPDIAEYAKRIIRFCDGNIIEDKPVLNRRRVMSEVVA